MSVFQDVRLELVDKLRAAGVEATANPAVTPPCVLIGVPVVTAAQGVGGWAGEFPVWIISPPPDSAQGLAWRLDQLEACYRSIGFAPAYVDSWGDRDAPAYLLTYPRTVTNPDC